MQVKGGWIPLAFPSRDRRARSGLELEAESGNLSSKKRGFDANQGISRRLPESYRPRHFASFLPPMKRPSPRQFQKLDVRPLFRKGGEPFPAIMAKVNALSPEEGLELVAPFMPAPLVEMLGSQGFTADMERSEDGSWIVWFWREK